MSPALRTALLGAERSKPLLLLWLAATILVALTTFAAYASGVFEAAGGVVWIPYGAVLIGALATATVGYLRGGAVLGWLVMFAALWGFLADHAILGLSSRPLTAQVAYLVRLDGLSWLGVTALVVGVGPYLLGVLARWGTDSIRRREIAATGE